MLFLGCVVLFARDILILTFRNCSYVASKVFTIAGDVCFVNSSNRAVKEPSINQRSSLWSIHLRVGVHDKSTLWQINSVEYHFKHVFERKMSCGGRW